MSHTNDEAKKPLNFKKIFPITPARVLVFGFATVILLGAILLALPVATISGQSIGFVNALFEATSAVCVTGLVVVDTATTFSVFGKIVIISLIQIGGLGFMTFATTIGILIGKKINLKERMLIKESLNQVTMEGMVKLAKYVVLVTLSIEGLGAIILTLAWLKELGWPNALYYGIFHAISSFCNAGFDLFGEYRSLTGFVDNYTVNLTVSTLIILGGIGFTVMADLYTKRSLRRLSLHTKLVLLVSLILIIFGTVFIFLTEYSNPKTLQPLSMSGKILSSYFQSVSPRTAGYNTLNLADLTMATQFLMVILMFIGASPSSTGGGIKTSTFGSMVVAVIAMIRGKEEAEIFNRRIPKEQIYKALSVTMLALFLVLFITMVLSITENADFLYILFETVSAFGTVGLTLGLTTKLTIIGKLLISFTMFAGRVGPVTIALSIGEKRRKANYAYPEEKIIVG
jgi:trk system potassium uptake protein